MQGNKKGPLGRWDFDTQEEYSDYMNNKEALPKYVLRNIPLCFFWRKPQRSALRIKGDGGFFLIVFIVTRVESKTVRLINH